MNREDIIRMAREADVNPMLYDGKWAVSNLDLFAALIAAAEREACARIAEEVGNQDKDCHAWDAAAAIRARSEE